MEETLRKDICDYLKLSYEDSVKKSKIEEAKKIKFLKDDKFYKEKVFSLVDDTVLDNFNVELEFCENREQHDIWEYFRINTSSIRSHRNIGRYIRILVKHVLSQKYIGILSLGSDIYACKARDDVIGWDEENKKSKLIYVMNINCCVGLQSFAYNYNGGKLLVALCFSDIVLDYYKKKYGNDLACITTFSINGKSIQYDRIPQYLKFIGETKGYCMSNIPDKLYKKMLKYLESLNDINTLAFKNKRYKINKVLSYLGINEEGQKRGVYIGFTSKNSVNFLNNKIDNFNIEKKSVNDICEWWKNRWAKQRYEHLKKNNRLRYKIEFINAYKLYNIEKTVKSKINKINEIGEEQYKKNKALYMQNYRNKEVEIDIPKINNVKEINIKWLGGFIDGDGSINLCGNSKYIRFEISQCDINPLLSIQKKYGGQLSSKQNTGKKSRNIHKLTLTCNNTRFIINDLNNNVILEKEKINKCIEYYEAYDKVSDVETILNDISKKIKKSNESDYNIISNEYIAGLFDAEGEVSLEKNNKGYAKYSIKITQKSDINLLKAISKFLSYGNVDSKRLNIYKKEYIIDFINRVKPCIIVKYEQCDILLKYLNYNIELGIAIEQIKDIKHQQYNIKPDILQEQNSIAKQLAKVLNPIKNTIEQEEAKRKRNEEKSENMKGENHHFFGTTFSDEHRLKQKQSIALKKHETRLVTDEQIIEIRQEYKSGEKIQTIANKYNLKRQYISDIVHGKMLTKDELQNEELLKISLDKQKKDDIEKKESLKNNTSMELSVKKSVIARRKINADGIIEVIQYKLLNPTYGPTKILSNFKDKYKHLTIDMVKNYIKGKVAMFEDEFPIENFKWDDFIQFKESMK